MQTEKGGVGERFRERERERVMQWEELRKKKQRVGGRRKTGREEDERESKLPF